MFALTVGQLRKCRDTGGHGRDEMGPYIMNVTQAPSRSPCATLVPALIRNSNLFSMKHQRILTVQEMLQVQGFPVFDGADCPYLCDLVGFVVKRHCNKYT